MRRPSAGLIVSLALVLAIAGHAFGVISAPTLDWVAMASVFWLGVVALGGAGLARPVATLGAAALVGGLLWAQIAMPGLRYMPFILIVPANVMMGFIFARGVFTDRQPVLVQLIELMNERPVDPRFRRFVERQCLLWSVLCFATAGLALAAMVLTPWRGAFGLLLTGLIAAQILWFALSHYYAQIRYQRPETCWTTVRTMLRPGVWAQLRV